MSAGFQLRSSPRLWGLLALASLLALACVVAVGGPQATSAEESYEANIRLVDSNGNGLSGGRVNYYSGGSWKELGTTDGNGLITATLPKKEYRIEIYFRRGHIRTPAPVDITDYTFQTVKVHFLNSKTMHFQGYYLGFGSFSGPIELLPYTYTFTNENDLSNRFTLTIGPEGFTGGLLRLVDSEGNGLAGGSASYFLGSWVPIPGQTDENGNLVFEVPNDSPSLNIAMSYLGTREQKSRMQLADSNFTFKTAPVNVELRNADGALIDTGSVAYYAGGQWRTFGDGATNGGVVTQQMLTGSTVSFAMVYNHTREQKDQVALSPSGTTVTFQTGRLNMSYSGTITWYSGTYWTYANGMEFLPGTMTFNLSSQGGGCSVSLPIASGDKLVKSAIVATLHSSSGAPLAGGDASAYAGGAWKTIGTTDGSGRTCALLDGTLGNTTVRMVYEGTSQNLTQHHPTNSIYAFKTALVTVELRDSGGQLIDTGSASYYAGSWKALGDTQGGVVTANLLPGSYSFAMVYNGTREQKNSVAISGSATTVTFNTTNVTVQLRDSSGAPLDTGTASYYAGSWRTIGNTVNGDVSVEMLPGSYSFAMTYLGTRQQLNSQSIDGAESTVTFQTGKVVSDSGTATKYYAGRWLPFTDGMELLPGTYTFSFSGAPNKSFALLGGVENHID